MRIQTLAICTALSLAGAAAHAQQQSVDGPVIRASCNRFLVKDVIWDTPNGVFVEDLRQYGYNAVDAQAIALTVCRDERLVGNPDAIMNTTIELMRENPPRR